MQHDASTLTEVRTHRIQNALWGLFIGDALAMPAHWFYRLQNIKETFDGGITDFVDPPHPHPESFMAGMTYRPNIENAKKLGRRYDILHQHARFYQTNFSTFNITTDNRETEHGNAVPKLANRFHYHHGLKAGENGLMLADSRAGHAVPVDFQQMQRLFAAVMVRTYPVIHH